MQSNNQLCNNIEAFISQHQPVYGNKSQLKPVDSKHLYTFPTSSKFETIVPLPSCCLLFSDGELKEWTS